MIPFEQIIWTTYMHRSSEIFNWFLTFWISRSEEKSSVVGLSNKLDRSDMKSRTQLISMNNVSASTRYQKYYDCYTPAQQKEIEARLQVGVCTLLTEWWAIIRAMLVLSPSESRCTNNKLWFVLHLMRHSHAKFWCIKGEIECFNAPRHRKDSNQSCLKLSVNTC